MKKNNYISQLRDGQTVSDVFVITSARQAQSKNGPYWMLRLQDASGEIEARIWSPQSQEYQDLAANQVVTVDGQATSFRGELQLNINRLERVDPETVGIDWSQLIPSSDPPPEEIMDELEELCRTELTYKPWRTLCRSVLGNTEIRERMLAAPAAKSIHHAYRGGLLRHTLDVCRLCLRICEGYPHVDREILLVAAVFHDMGKAWEIGSDVSREYTDPGKLLGHIMLGMEVLEPFLKKTRGLDPDLVLHLKHIIVGHHGELAFGSPRVPMTREAFVLHFADNLDAKLATVDSLLDGLDQEADSNWTGYHRMLERQIYRPAQTPSPDSASSKNKSGLTQCSLPLKA